ncbi:hypothetical protein HanXRQr2_Chr06g0268341 [Helianthus annuus]|uniref:Uncharacterized protein n=1 Tax=Helianthus annuus TaxID=4232 RepID=A0A9K3IU94_HELAN|nr:hypothetical protein HanXRQr2_Chr06g0268341 [Helianthus annuus]
MATTRKQDLVLLAGGGFDKGNGHSRSMLTRDLRPYPFSVINPLFQNNKTNRNLKTHNG